MMAFRCVVQGGKGVVVVQNLNGHSKAGKAIIREREEYLEELPTL